MTTEIEHLARTGRLWCFWQHVDSGISAYWMEISCEELNCKEQLQPFSLGFWAVTELVLYLLWFRSIKIALQGLQREAIQGICCNSWEDNRLSGSPKGVFQKAFWIFLFFFLNVSLLIPEASALLTTMVWIIGHLHRHLGYLVIVRSGRKKAVDRTRINKR